MAKGPELACVSEIRCKSTKGFGSGYLIRPDLILTACHVISEQPMAVAPTDIEVRPLDDMLNDRKWRSGTLVWPPEAEYAQLWPLDLALVKIEPDEHTRAIAHTKTLGSQGLRGDRPLGVTTVGFPRFKEIKQEKMRDSQQLFGKVALFSSVKRQKYDITYGGSQPPADQDWHGISGAALFAGDQILGAVTLKVNEAGIDFRAARIEPALLHPGFSALVGPEVRATRRNPVRPSTWSGLDTLVCLVDRHPQENAFGPVLSQLVAGRVARPLCCIVAGRSCHWPDELIARFSLDTIPRILKRPTQQVEILPIPWPQSVTQIAAELSLLRQGLWSLIGDLDTPAPEDAETFSQRLNEVSRPHLFFSELTPDPGKPEVAVLLASWFTFWSTLQPSAATRTPVHFIITRDVDVAQINDWLQAIAVPPAMQLCVLPQLDLCFWSDLRDWLERRVKLHRPISPEDFNQLKVDLERQLLDIVGGPQRFSLSDLKQAVRSMTRPTARGNSGRG